MCPYLTNLCSSLLSLNRNKIGPNVRCSCTSEKRLSQWEELMRKFSRAHKEVCKAETLNIPRVYRSTKYFPTGSQYKGTWDVLGMSGYGTYTFPNGVVYVGDFEDGMFHGIGQLRYQDGIVLSGYFDKGVMTHRELTFPDGLKYEEQNWKYCKKPDRRYAVEYAEGLKPAGISNITAVMPPRKIPPGSYDTGDGFYNPVAKCVYRADDVSSILRSPSQEEQIWIIANCRVNPEPTMGPSMHLYEKWSVPEETLPPVPEPASATRTKVSTRRRSLIPSHDICTQRHGQTRVSIKKKKKKKKPNIAGKCKLLKTKARKRQKIVMTKLLKLKVPTEKSKKLFYNPNQWPFVVGDCRWIYDEFIRPIECLLYADDDISHKTSALYPRETKSCLTATEYKQKYRLTADFQKANAFGYEENIEIIPRDKKSSHASSNSFDCVPNSNVVDVPNDAELPREPSIRFKKVHYLLHQLFQEKLFTHPARADNLNKKFTP